MAAGFIYAWDDVNKVWVKILCNDDGEIKTVTA